MTLTDPAEALGEQSSFVGYLVGLAGLGRAVRSMAAERPGTPGSDREADDFVHVLLGLASLGESIERLAEPVGGEHASPSSTVEPRARWMR